MKRELSLIQAQYQFFILPNCRMKTTQNDLENLSIFLIPNCVMETKENKNYLQSFLIQCTKEKN